MSQPPDPGQPSDQGQPPSWPSSNELPSWPSGAAGQGPPPWPSGGANRGPPPRPSEDQPQPSWPSGPGQGPQSSWPPEDQPPYPGPGYTYGYGPRPPRLRRRHPVRGALIALGLFVLFGLVVRTATASHTAVSATSSGPSAGGAPATERQAPPGTIGSSFELVDGSGDTYRITLAAVVDPARGASEINSPAGGKRFVGVVFTIKALTGSPQNEDAYNDAALVGSDGQTYPADFDDIAGHANFDTGLIHVAQGDTVTGSVTFQVPNGVTVSRVQWTALSGFGPMVEWNVHR